MTLLHRECVLCGSRELTPCFACRDHYGSGERFDLVDCRICGFRMTNPCPSLEAIGAYYRSESYVPLSNTRAGLINKLYHPARRLALLGKARWIRREHGRRPGRLLDIGCGTGEFLNSMQRRGWAVCGIDPDAGAREQARRHFGIEVATLERLWTLDVARFDLVTLWHVLEHVHALHETVSEVRAALAPGGIAIIGCPNHHCLDADIYGADWAAYDVPRHLWHFNPDSMRRLLLKHGLRLRRILPMRLDPLYIPLLSERGRGSDGNLLRGMIVGLRSSIAALRDPSRCTAVAYVAEEAGATRVRADRVDS